MSGFSAQWLALREPLDAASRAPDVGAQLATALRGSRPPASVLQVVDLGAGTGANLRYVAPLLECAQDWLLVEHDPALLAALDERLPPWLAAMPLRLQARSLALDLAGGLANLPLPTGALLTASALLDLVSEQWLHQLLSRASAARASVWFALTYDGRMQCQPPEPEDAEVQELVNRHQRGDKGFGAALGPLAAARAASMLAGFGYRVHAAFSDWRIGPEAHQLQRVLLEGWYGAACETAPERTGALRGWLQRRQVHVDAGGSRLVVGHVDLAGSW